MLSLPVFCCRLEYHISVVLMDYEPTSCLTLIVETEDDRLQELDCSPEQLASTLDQQLSMVQSVIGTNGGTALLDWSSPQKIVSQFSALQATHLRMIRSMASTQSRVEKVLFSALL